MDSGNDRKNAEVVQALIERPKSVLYESGKEDKQKKVVCSENFQVIINC